MQLEKEPRDDAGYEPSKVIKAVAVVASPSEASELEEPKIKADAVTKCNGMPSKRVTRATTSLFQEVRLRDSVARNLIRLVLDVFGLKGYEFNASSPTTTLELLANSVDILEELIEVFANKIASKSASGPIEWLRKNKALMFQGAKALRKIEDDLTPVLRETAPFVARMNSTGAVIEDWLLEFLYQVLEESKVEAGSVSQELRDSTVSIMEHLTPRILPHSFDLPDNIQFELYLRASEMLKLNEPSAECEGMDTLQLWTAKLQDLWFLHGHAASKEIAVQFWWFMASYFSTISDPVNELGSLQEITRLLEPPCTFEFPCSTYGTLVSPSTLAEKEAQAELRCSMLRIEKKTDISIQEALSCLKSLSTQLENPDLSSSFRFKLAQNIVTLCNFSCLSKTTSLPEEERESIIKANFCCHLILLGFRTCEIFSLLGNLAKDPKDSSTMASIYGIIEKISETTNILASMLEQSEFQSHLGKYLPESEFQTIAQITLVVAQLSFSLYLDDTVRDHVSLHDPLQRLIISTVKFISNVLVALPPAIPDPDFLVGLSKFLSTAHSHLGACSACELEGGALPKLCIRIFLMVDDAAIEPSDVYQCYYCLYHVVVGGTLKEKEKHTRQPQALDMAGVSMIFQELWPNIEGKVVRGKMASLEFKAVLDKLSQYLIETPLFSSASVTYNLATVNRYLHSEGSLSCMRDHALPPLDTVDVIGSPLKIPWVYTRLFLSQAMLQFYQIRTRLKTQIIADTVDWDSIIVPLKFHLGICPSSVEGWYYLALTYAEASGGMMRKSATYIRSHHSAIAEFQKKGLLCFSEGARIMKATVGPAFTKAYEFWAEFGLLVYVSVTAPMELAAFELKGSSQGSVELSRTQQFSNVFATSEQAFGLAFSLFRRANRIEKTWEMNVMMAKCLYKLGKAPDQILPLLFNAAMMAPNDAIEPSYQLINFLFKCAQKRSIADDTVTRTLAGIKHLGVDPKAAVSDGLIKAVESLKAIDKRKWHHKLTYLHARIYLYMVKDNKRALEEMQNVIKIQSIPSSFINVWKPEAERAGKHYVYVSQYIMFIFKISGPGATYPFLDLMLRRIGRVVDSIYRLEHVWQTGMDMYIKAVRRQLNVLSCPLVDLRWSSEFFTSCVMATEKKIIAQLAHSNPDQIPVEVHDEHQIYLCLKSTLDIVKIANGSVTSSLGVLHLIVDLYGKLLEMFQFDVGNFAPNSTVQVAPLAIADLVKLAEKFNRDFVAACK
ncbi:Histone transcription regulator 3 [Entomophthora muscae]|uniref:Histone transcription regulator 3 n=1 Tax=Entomophthora muscae TaxID=34485 RepID=A0ACC2T556_9FUNG|nr:Histone transcription regulator 3 [Entomophthora muscae]